MMDLIDFFVLLLLCAFLKFGIQLNKLRQELSHLASEKASITVVSGNSRSSGELIAWNISFMLLKIKVFRFLFRLYNSEHNDLNFGNNIPRLRFFEIHLKVAYVLKFPPIDDNIQKQFFN